MCSKKQPVFYCIKVLEREKKQKKDGMFGHFREKNYFCAAKNRYVGTQALQIIHRRYTSPAKLLKKMKQGIHPDNYRPVVFKDMSNGDMFLSRSTAKTTDTVEFEGETYPVVKLEISSSSHPFYTGKSKLVDTAGRVDKFMNRYARTRK